MAKTQFKQIKSEVELYTANDLYTKTEIDQMLGSPMHYKGNVATYADLTAITEKTNGDLYNVTATGKNYVWNDDENEWDDISGIVDLSNYYTKTETDDTFATKGSVTTVSSNLSTHVGDTSIHVTTAEKTAWNEKQDEITATGILKGTTSGVVAAVAGTDYVAPESGKGLSTNDYTTAEKTKLNGIATGAEVNQNAFSNVKVGDATLSATGKTDTFEIVAGSNISVTPDATTKKITISSSSAVTSVNGKTGAVVLTGDDLKLSSGVTDTVSETINNLDTAHANHVADTNNPHNVTKAQVGLGNVDNTSDLNKPISTATQTALNGKVNKSTLTTYLTTGSTGVLNQFPTSNYTLEELVTHYNKLLKALSDMVGTLS